MSGYRPRGVTRSGAIAFPTAGLVTRRTGAISCFGLAAVDDIGVLGLDRGLLLGGKFGSAQDVTSWNAPEIFTPMISGFGGRRADFNCVQASATGWSNRPVQPGDGTGEQCPAQEQAANHIRLPVDTEVNTIESHQSNHSSRSSDSQPPPTRWRQAGHNKGAQTIYEDRTHHVP